jgi:ferredoxin
MSETLPKEVFYKAAKVFLKAGKMPFPVSDTIAKIMEVLLTEEQAEFVQVFRKNSYTFEQLKERAKNLDDETLKEKLNSLMKVAAVTAIPSRSTGQIIYYVSPLMPGMMEFEFMKGLSTEKHKKLARLHEQFFADMTETMQKNYDKMVPMMKNAPAISRTVPVEETIAPADQEVVPFEEISKLLDVSGTIAVGSCYCKHGKDLVNDPCKRTNERKVCFTLGRSADFLISQGFVEPCSKEKALEIFKKCEEDGLVHKVVHRGLDPNRAVDAICNCCKCCCGILGGFRDGWSPLMDVTSHLAKVNEDECIGCGTCVEKCNIEAVEVIDDIAVVDENVCIGCGLCASSCPSGAMTLERTELRQVFVPPRKLSKV